jgi:hypothetical protein
MTGYTREENGIPYAEIIVEDVEKGRTHMKVKLSSRAAEYHKPEHNGKWAHFQLDQFGYAYRVKPPQKSSAEK